MGGNQKSTFAWGSWELKLCTMINNHPFFVLTLVVSRALSLFHDTNFISLRSSASHNGDPERTWGWTLFTGDGPVIRGTMCDERSTNPAQSGMSPLILPLRARLTSLPMKPLFPLNDLFKPSPFVAFPVARKPDPRQSFKPSLPLICLVPSATCLGGGFRSLSATSEG